MAEAIPVDVYLLFGKQAAPIVSAALCRDPSKRERNEFGTDRGSEARKSAECVAQVAGSAERRSAD